MTTTHTEHSSINVDRDEVSNGIVVHHFTGLLLMSEFEANHLRALLTRELPGVPEMPLDEAEQIVADRDAMIAAVLS